ncbi:MAG: aminopeptidase N [Hyphomicrobiales bacterium]|nr:MAG: aminopeptidase N [Hyphomicrobiales bacterium]
MSTSSNQVIHLKNYREPDYWIREVDLRFCLEPEETLVHSKILIERNGSTAVGTKFELAGDELELVSVSINGKDLDAKDYRATPQLLTLKKLPKAKKFTIEISTKINPTANTKLMGLYRSGGNYCTQCEAEGFRRITYFLDRPDVLAVYTTRIEANKSDNPVLLGNGNPTKKGKLANGRHYAVWHDPHPKPSYLFALVAGDLGLVKKNFTTSSGRKVKLGIYVENGKEPRAAYAMDALVRSMIWDEEVFGCEYDLDVFNIVAVSDFNMGAMENKGLNVFNDKYVLANPTTATDDDYARIEAIIAHEYFHNWTGNRITCRDWFQLCLKEGLTVFRDQEFSSDARSRAVKRIADVKLLKSNQFPEDAGPLAHCVRPESYSEINNFYTATIYEKGAEIVRMLHTSLGDKMFRKGLSRYLKKHDGDAATIEDFLACFEFVSKRDLSQFSLWYSQAGTPSLSVSSQFDIAKGRFSVEIEQSLGATPGQVRKKLMEIPVAMALFSPDGRQLKPGKITGSDSNGDVYFLRKRRHRIVFEGVTARPVLSINRGFSAPVNVDYTLPKSDLIFLALNDNDLFTRWNAFQTYASNMLIGATRSLARGKTPKWDKKLLDVCVEIAGDENLEPAFRTAMLSLVSEGDLAQIIGKNVNPDAIHRARKSLMTEIGTVIEPVRAEIFKGLATAKIFNPESGDAGRRSLKNLLLTLGVFADSENAEKESLRQFKNADNMTDQYAAMQRIVHLHGSAPDSKNALDVFYKQFSNDHIVLDKWFMVQASVPGEKSERLVTRLTRHEDFSITNPNRVRATIGVFASANPTGFNAQSGKGYALVANTVKKLDKINPQVAARMLTAFRSYRSLEPVRRKLAETALKDLAKTKTLSKDVSDILSRTLG